MPKDGVGKIKLIGSVIAIIFSAVSLIYTTVYSPLSVNIKEACASVSTERDKREAADREIQIEVMGKLDSMSRQMTETKEAVARIEGKLAR